MSQVEGIVGGIDQASFSTSPELMEDWDFMVSQEPPPSAYLPVTYRRF